MLSQVRTNLLIEAAHHMLKVVFQDHMDEPGEAERYQQLLQLVEMWIRIKDVYLDKKTDFTDDEVVQFQEEADTMGEMFRHLYGASKTTPYLHDLFDGVLREYLLKYKNLNKLSNVGPEAAVGSMRSISDRRCNRGHVGKDGKGGVVDCIQNNSLRKITRTLDFLTSKVPPNDRVETTYNDISREDLFVKQGKSERAAKIKLERMKSKELEAKEREAEEELRTRAEGAGGAEEEELRLAEADEESGGIRLF